MSKLFRQDPVQAPKWTSAPKTAASQGVFASATQKVEDQIHQRRDAALILSPMLEKSCHERIRPVGRV
jgi:hypothetical protein